MNKGIKFSHVVHVLSRGVEIHQEMGEVYESNIDNFHSNRFVARDGMEFQVEWYQPGSYEFGTWLGWY